MKFLDICAGIGGFRSGLEQAGHECIGYVEIDKYARLSYEAMYDTKGEWTEHDITKVRANDIPQADIWCFGFPCQDISVAGNRKGLSGKRSGIFYDIIKLLKSQSTEDKPEWLLIENVKNLLSIDQGEGFTEVLNQISEAGFDCEWALLNSKDFGVPQNRERVFIVGHLRERGRREVLSQTGADRQADREVAEKSSINALVQSYCQDNRIYGINGISKTILGSEGGGIGNGHRTGLYAVPKVDMVLNNTKKNRERVVSSEGIARCLTSTDYKEPQRVAVPKQIIPGNQAHRVYDSEGLSVTVKAEGGGVGAKSGLYAVPKINKVLNSTQHFSVVDSEGISPTISACDYKDPQKVTVPTIDTVLQGKYSQDIILNENSLSRALMSRDYKGAQNVAVTANSGEYGIYVHNGKEYNIRRLTPKECFRLQGFTDDQFEKAREVNSDTQLYKQAGNAVTVNVARYLGELLN